MLWCNKVELGFENKGDSNLESVEKYIINFLSLLAHHVLKDLEKQFRQKLEQIITDFGILTK